MDISLSDDDIRLLNNPDHLERSSVRFELNDYGNVLSTMRTTGDKREIHFDGDNLVESLT